MKGGLFFRAMLVLIFLALVANVVIVAVRGESLVTLPILKAAVFGALGLANLFLAGAGIYFTTRAHQKHEKSSIEWGRRGFIVNALVTVLLLLAPWFFFPSEVSRVQAMFDVSCVLLLFGASSGTFTFSFYREYLRNVGDRGAPSRRPNRQGARNAAEVGRPAE